MNFFHSGIFIIDIMGVFLRIICVIIMLNKLNKHGGDFMLGIRIDSKTEHRLDQLCQKTGHTKSYYTRKALNEFLDDREDYLLGIAALGEKEGAVSLKDLEKTLGLADRD